MHGSRRKAVARQPLILRNWHICHLKAGSSSLIVELVSGHLSVLVVDIRAFTFVRDSIESFLVLWGLPQTAEGLVVLDQSRLNSSSISRSRNNRRHQSFALYNTLNRFNSRTPLLPTTTSTTTSTTTTTISRLDDDYGSRRNVIQRLLGNSNQENPPKKTQSPANINNFKFLASLRRLFLNFLIDFLVDFLSLQAEHSNIAEGQVRLVGGRDEYEVYPSI